MNNQVSVTVPPVARQSHSDDSVTSIALIHVIPPATPCGAFQFRLEAQETTLPVDKLGLVFAEDDATQHYQFAQHCQRAILRYRLGEGQDEKGTTNKQRWGFISPGVLLEGETPTRCRLRHEITGDARELRLEIDRVERTCGKPIEIPFRMMTVCFDTTADNAVGGRVQLTQDPALIITRPQDPA